MRSSERRHDNITVDPIGPVWFKQTTLFLPMSDWPLSTSQVDLNPFGIHRAERFWLSTGKSTITVR